MDLPRDWIDLFALLRSHRVRYLIVGAHALAAHGRPRATQDIDLFVDPTEANAKRLGAALGEFGLPALARSWRRFAERDRIATIGNPPLQVDIMTSISGVDFRSAWRNRMAGTINGHPVAYLSRDDLVANKRSAGRTKDLLDVALLEEGTPPRRNRGLPPKGTQRS